MRRASACKSRDARHFEAWMIDIPTISAVVVAVSIVIGLVFTVMELMEKFGDEYREYKKRTPRTIPRFRSKRTPAQ